MSRRLLLVLCGGSLLLLCAPALAAAAPVTVNLRIEGRATTLYERAVTTDIRTIDVGDGTGAHTCDGTNASANPTPGPTRGAALQAAATGPGGFSFEGSWSTKYEDASFSEIAGESVAYEDATGAFLGEYKNGVSSQVGSCQDKIADGDDVLYAYAPFGTPLLKLSGPGIADPAGPATLRVSDATTGAPIAGATVGGAKTTADGTVRVAISLAANSFKATKPGTVRSNRLSVCGSTGTDGICGVRDRTAPVAGIRGIAEGQRFARKKGPRRLRAHIDADPSGLLMVKLRLTRNAGRGRCTYFSGRSERLRRSRKIGGSRCGATHGYWFRVGDQPDVDYLLPKRLPRGRYVLDVNAIDKAYNRDDVRQRGRNRVVFYVR